MGDPKRTDMLVAGEELAPFTFQVTEEFNENFLHSMEDFHPRYMEGVKAVRPPSFTPACSSTSAT